MTMNQTGSRAALVAELRDRAEGWHHLCKDALRDASSAAAADLEAGHVDEVQVGHTLFRVTE